MINYVVVLVYVWQKIKIKKISRHELKKLETWKRGNLRKKQTIYTEQLGIVVQFLTAQCFICNHVNSEATGTAIPSYNPMRWDTCNLWSVCSPENEVELNTMTLNQWGNGFLAFRLMRVEYDFPTSTVSTIFCIFSAVQERVKCLQNWDVLIFSAGNHSASLLTTNLSRIRRWSLPSFAAHRSKWPYFYHLFGFRALN